MIKVTTNPNRKTGLFKEFYEKVLLLLGRVLLRTMAQWVKALSQSFDFLGQI